MSKRNDKIRELIKRCTTINTYSQELARAYLVKLGTHNKDGTLHKNYGA